MSDYLFSDTTGGTKQETPQNAEHFAEIPSLTPDAMFEVLADSYRRVVLSYLEHRFDGTASLSELAAYVSQHACAGDDPAQIAVQLHHSHLPKLDEAGLLDYDATAQTVEYVGHPGIEACLDLVEVE